MAQEDGSSMLSSYLGLTFNKETFYNVSMSVSVVHCSTQNITATPPSSTETEEPFFRSWGLAFSQFLDPWSADFVEPLTILDVPAEVTEQQLCNETLKTTFSVNLYPAQIFNSLLALLLMFIVLPLLYWLFWFLVSRLRSQLRNRQSRVIRQTSKVAPLTAVQKSDIDEACSGGLPAESELSKSCEPDFHNTALRLPPAVSRVLPLNTKCIQLDKGDIGKFMLQTLDLLNTGLNRVLWKTTPSGGSSSLASPTLSRRWSASLNPRLPPGRGMSSLRRAGRSSSSLASMDTDDEMQLDGWDAYEETLQRLEWRQSIVPKLNHTRVGVDGLQQILSFVSANPSTDGGQWRASCMVVTYLIALLEKELQRLPNSLSNGLIFVEFVSLGSSRKGTKTGKPNEFDVLMVLQPTGSGLEEAIVSGKVDGLPAGKTVLVTGEVGLGPSKRFVKEMHLQDGKKNCLVTRQTVFNAHGLLDSALAEVASTCRKLSEKMPYRIQKIVSKSTFSRITLDTKPIGNVGFDVEEIFVNIIPAICIADGGLQRLPLYAVPDWNQQASSNTRLAVSKRNKSVEGDVLWSFCTTALEEAYLTAINKRMKLTGIDSCHVMCLLVLKTLLQCKEADGQPTDSEGMSGYWLETVVNFLLLESASEMWTFDKLTNRISDAVIFFKQALKNQRLPHFFVGNPHLLKQFPYLRWFPWLSGDKQINLMSCLTEQTAERLVKHVDERIESAPFSQCIRREFSSDMWEYEFFVF